MPPAAGVVAQGDRVPMNPVVFPAAAAAAVVVPQPQQAHPGMVAAAPEVYAKDAIIAWFRGEFAAANAIIDALCGHLKRLEGGEAAAYGSAQTLSAAHKYKVRGSQEVQHLPDNIEICSNHDFCEARRAQIKMIKGFVAREPVKGNTVNVVRGLKLYEDIFTDGELSKLNDFVNELRAAGQNGQLSGETFILYNQQTKGNKRELIQLGVPIFGKIKEDEANTVQKSYIEPIPALLQSVTEHLIQWRLIPENTRPNSCIISFFDEGEYSQPFLKPPHLEHPLSTLLLHESTMAFGRTLVSHGEGNYKGSLNLSLEKGSLLVMRGNSSEIARHVMCSSLNKRTSITFFRVRADSSEKNHSPLSKAMTLWQPGVPAPYTGPNNYEPMSMVPKWGLLRSPIVMLGPVRPLVVSPGRGPQGGTGVFLPWAVGSRKHTKQLPPRAQRGRFLALPSPVGSGKNEAAGSDSGFGSS
ncbi:oxidoreductase- 2OG-Fe(II) oxygenase family protein [Striga hermonthica]|uniref:Oxidoreductase- 2OG-Fe(II) oxygenase family protein n=1 Tax=Striga hermonthica TaxID=68872 RepID=A0A9N7RHI3_STRHE|nr:oxidoreductase- 2OG-Fe(II) oxygenase family protein [Striga hermonthica]